MAETDAVPAARRQWFVLIRFVIGTMASSLLTVAGLLISLAALGSSLPGWGATVVGSGSMAPALAVGDVVIVRQQGVQDPAPTPGQVILVARAGFAPLLHRVVGERTGLIVTRGDANNHPDSDLVNPAGVLGTGTAVLPWVGLPSLWVAQKEWVTLICVVVLAGVFGWLGRFGWLRQYDPWLPQENRAAEARPNPDAEDDFRDDANPISRDRAPSSEATVPAPVRPGTRGPALRRVALLVVLGLGLTQMTADAQFSGNTKPPTPRVTAATMASPTTFTEVRTCQAGGASDFAFSWNSSGSRKVDAYVILSSMDANRPLATINSNTQAFADRTYTANVPSTPKDTTECIIAKYKSWESDCLLTTTATKKSC